jgi:hypothetical protein
VFLNYRCSAALQRLCFFSTAAQRCSGEAQRCSGKALQRQHARSAEARSAENFKICSAKRAALQFEKNWPSLITAPNFACSDKTVTLYR